MDPVAASDLLHGNVLVAVPHFDDEVLGCGGLLAGAPDKSRIRVVYTTSGRGSENLGMPGVKADPSLDMGEVRRRESLEALAVLGIGPAQARFLDVPEYRVAEHAEGVRRSYERILDEVKPDVLLAPFRFDKHADHIALGMILRSLLWERRSSCELLEYFVYWRWRMVPSGDIRRHVRPDRLVTVDLAAQSAKKREALECFRSQTTLYFPWQTRVVLTRELIEEVSRGPECFVRGALHVEDRDLLTLPLPWVRFAHAVEPALKRRAEQMKFLFASAKKKLGGQAAASGGPTGLA